MPTAIVSPPRDYEVISPQEAADRELAKLLRGSPVVKELLAQRDAAVGAERDQLAASLRDAEVRDAEARPALVAEADRLAESFRVVAQAAHNARVLAERAAMAVEQHDAAVANTRDSILRRLRASCPAEIQEAQRSIRDAIEAARAEFRTWREDHGQRSPITFEPIYADVSNAAEIDARVAELTDAARRIGDLATSADSPATIRAKVREILKSVNVAIEEVK